MVTFDIDCPDVNLRQFNLLQPYGEYLGQASGLQPHFYHAIFTATSVRVCLAIFRLFPVQ